jgi:putative ABC transport system permease protein
MKRRLFTQMRTEWRSNIWMLVELTIVGLIVTLIGMMLSQLYFLHSRPQGYDLTNVYVGANNMLTAESDNYVKYDEWQRNIDDMNMILRRLRENPNVEMVAAGTAAMPYNHNFGGTRMTLDSLEYTGNTREFTPELARLIHLVGPNGETTEQIAAALERGEWLVTNLDENNNYFNSCDPYQLKDKTVILDEDSTKTAYVGMVCCGIARDDYEGLPYGNIIRPLDLNRQLPLQIIVRVKPGMGRKFMESLSSKDLEQGNMYVNNFTSIDDMRESCQREITNLERSMIICAVFLLVAVFLGFLGSFWFRTQQRVPEIALRKVNGATQWQIFSRLISEGLILLLISAIIFTPICFYIINIGIFDELMSANTQLPNVIAYVITLAVLAAMIVAGICFPARRAMKIEPAYALKDQ